MKDLIRRYSASAAYGFTGIGPKPTLAPPNEGNGGGTQDGDNDGGAGDDNGGSGDKSGDGGGDNGDGGEGDKSASRASRMGGLFGKRSNASGGDDGGNDQQGKEGADDGRPEGLADKFWNAKTKTVNSDALAKAYTDLEKAHGQLKRTKGTVGGEVPENENEYFADTKTIALPDTVDRLTLPPDDPGLKVAAQVFKKYGIGKDAAAGIVKDMFAGMNEFAPVPIDPDEEMKSLGKGGPALVDGLFTWVEGMERSGDLSEDDIIVVEGIMRTANGARFLAKMRNMSGEAPIPVTPGSGQRGMSQDQWNEEMKEAIKKQDYKRQAELEEMGEMINGTEAAISSRAGGVNPERNRLAR